MRSKELGHIVSFGNRPKPKDGRDSTSTSEYLSYCCSILSDRQKSFTELKNSTSLLNGGVAQLGEHLPCKQGVKGSIPFISTNGEQDERDTPKRLTYGLIAQVVRARA